MNGGMNCPLTQMFDPEASMKKICVDKKGRPFINEDPIIFRNILLVLTYSVVPDIPIGDISYEAMVIALRFWGLITEEEPRYQEEWHG